MLGYALGMTLILTLVDRNRIVQVSDRRLAKRSDELYDDNANKAVIVGMHRINFAASYTGLAYIGREREDQTDRWLADNLGAITRDGETRLDHIADALAARATHAISRLRGEMWKKGLKIVLAGYDVENRPFRATVSNIRFRSHDAFEVRDRFAVRLHRYYPWDPKPDIDVDGAIGAFEDRDSIAKAIKRNAKKVIELVRDQLDRLPEHQVAEALVSLIRSANRHPRYEPFIGRDCLSVVAFPREPRRTALHSYTILYPPSTCKDALFTSFYHPVKSSTIHHQPIGADPHFTFYRMEVDTNPQIPDLPLETAGQRKTGATSTSGSAPPSRALNPTQAYAVW
jgi:hypothetical protein